MEGENLDNDKKKMEEETSGHSQMEIGKLKMEEGTDGQFQIEKGEKKMEEETEEQSQNSDESFQCYFCGTMVFSMELYQMHVVIDHPDIIPWKRTRKRKSDGRANFSTY